MSFYSHKILNDDISASYSRKSHRTFKSRAKRCALSTVRSALMTITHTTRAVLDGAKWIEPDRI